MIDVSERTSSQVVDGFSRNDSWPKGLTFTKEQIFCECKQQTIAEAWLDGLPSFDMHLSEAKSLFPTNRDSMDAWFEAATLYSRTNLTKASDRLVAVSRVARHFHKSHNRCLKTRIVLFQSLSTKLQLSFNPVVDASRGPRMSHLTRSLHHHLLLSLYHFASIYDEAFETWEQPEEGFENIRSKMQMSPSAEDEIFDNLKSLTEGGFFAGSLDSRDKIEIEVLEENGIILRAEVNRSQAQ
jgi:hypothetical protein